MVTAFAILAAAFIYLAFSIGSSICDFGSGIFIPGILNWQRHFNTWHSQLAAAFAILAVAFTILAASFAFLAAAFAILAAAFPLAAVFYARLLVAFLLFPGMLVYKTDLFFAIFLFVTESGSDKLIKSGNRSFGNKLFRIGLRRSTGE